MTGRIAFTDLGPGEVLRVSAKAVLIKLEGAEEHQWFPQSILSTATAAQCRVDHTIERVWAETWFCEKEELV